MSELTKEYSVKKDTGYYQDINDYLVPEDITVTITLREYRNLVKEVATAKYREDKIKVEHAEEILKKNGEIEQLRNKINKLLGVKEEEE